MHPKGPDAAAQVRTEHDVHGFVTRTCFKTGPPGRVGIESEWFVHDDRDADARVRPARPATTPRRRRPAARRHRPHLRAGRPDRAQHGLRATTRPPPSTVLRDDLRHLDKLLADHHLVRVGRRGHPRCRPAQRVLDAPRYAAMESFFDRDNASGRVMMTSTAAVQVSLDAGARRRATSAAGGTCSTTSRRCSPRRSPTPRCAAVGRPACAAPAPTCGRASTPAARGGPSARTRPRRGPVTRSRRG